MMLSLFALVALIPAVLGHGEIVRVQVLGGGSSDAPNIYYGGDSKNANTAIRTMFEASFPAFTTPADYGDAGKMSCESAGGAPKSLTVAAGQTVRVFWEGATGELDGAGFPYTGQHAYVHAMGPAMDYMAPCNGPCSHFDASQAHWTKIAHYGLDRSQSISGALRTAMTDKPEKYYPTEGNGVWAFAKMIQDGSQWDITIPANLQGGEYLLRNEFAATHNPLSDTARSGPQHYIGCIQLTVTGSGTDALPSGFLGSELYDSNGAFATYNVYADSFQNDFPIPGPAIWEAASSTPASPPPASSSSSSTSAQQPAQTPPADTPPANTPPADTPPANAPPYDQGAPASSSTSAAPASTTTAKSNGHCKRGSRMRRGSGGATRRTVAAAQHKRRMEH